MDWTSDWKWGLSHIQTDWFAALEAVEQIIVDDSPPRDKCLHGVEKEEPEEAAHSAEVA